MTDVAFPAGFTAIADADVNDDVWIHAHDGTRKKITRGQILGRLFAYNGSDATQFTNLSDIGSPVSPALSAVATDVLPINVLGLKLGSGTSAGDGRAWFAGTLVSVQGSRIRLGISVDPLNPIQPGESIYAGIFIASDLSTGSAFAIVVGIDDAGGGQLLLTTQSAYATTTTLISPAPVTMPGGYAWTLDIEFDAALRDTATYPPDGAPAIAGTVTIAGNTATAPVAFPFVVYTTDWDAGQGANPSNRVGVFASAGAPLTADTGVWVTKLRIEGAS